MTTEETPGPEALATEDPPPVRRNWLAVALASITAVAFLPAVGNGFLNWDDQENFLENFGFRGMGPENLYWAWTTVVMGVYQPLGWMILEAEFLAWGMNPLGYHAVSVLF